MSLYNDASLVMIPSGYKDGKVYSIKPTNGDGDFTFSRGSNLAATRVDVNGLIEKGRENLLLQSNQFDTTWVNTNSSVTSGQSGYDGSSDAWQVSISAAFAQVEQNVSNSGVQTFSVYAKAGTLNWVRLRVDHTTFSNTYFDLQNGVVGTTASDIDSSIESIGGGWYRCSLTFNDSITKVRIYPAQADNDLTATSGSIYIQDAQLEAGLVATDYIETTTTTAQAGILEDMPRLDYSGSCPSLLLEAQRSNLLPHSEYMTSSNWIGSQTTAAVVLSSNLSPEGKRNCYQVTRSSSLTTQVGTFTTITNGSTYTGSIYVRSVSGSLSVDLVNVNGLATTKSITTDWTRIDITATATSTTGRLYLKLLSDGDVVEIYGAQLEEGSYATSYIPTYGASVTALKDACTNFTFNDLQTTDASIFVEFNYDSDKSGAFRFVFNTENSTSGSLDAIQLNSTAGGTVFSFAISGSGVSFSTLSLLSGTNKALIKFERSSGAVKTFLNGAEVDSGTASSIPEIHKISLGARINPFASFNTDRQLGDTIKQFLAFPTALTDSECIALTTL